MNLKELKEKWASGGKKAAKRMTKEQRRARALKASHATRHYKNFHANDEDNDI